MPVSVDGFDAIIAAVAERDALVARLGELEKEIRWLAGNNNPKCHLRWADTLARVVKSTATQTSSKKSGDD